MLVPEAAILDCELGLLVLILTPVAIKSLNGYQI